MKFLNLHPFKIQRTMNFMDRIIIYLIKLLNHNLTRKDKCKVWKPSLSAMKILLYRLILKLLRTTSKVQTRIILITSIIWLVICWCPSINNSRTKSLMMMLFPAKIFCGYSWIKSVLWSVTAKKCLWAQITEKSGKFLYFWSFIGKS